LLDADDLRRARNHTLSFDRLQGAPHRILAGRIGDEDDGCRRIRALRIVAAVRPRAAVALHDRFERDLLVREQPGDRRQGAGPVDGCQPDIVAALVTLHRRLLAGGEPGAWPAEWRGAQPARDVADVGTDRRGGGVTARAGADQRDRRKSLGVDRDRVGHAHHLRDRAVLRDHGRVHALLDALLGAHRDAEQLDAIAELVGGLEILRRDRGDALHEHRLLVDLDAERDAREDRELLCGVVSLDVEGRVGLGVAELLGVREAVREGELLALHPGQYVVAGAVEDAGDTREGVAGEPLAQGLHHRDGAADRRLEIERRVALLGEPGEREAVAREQRLVGGDNGLSRRERRLDRGLGGIARPADQLDEDVDVRIGRERHRIVHPFELAQVDRPLLRLRARRHGHHLDFAAAARRERAALAVDELDHRGADGSESGKTHSQRGDHGFGNLTTAPKNQRRLARGTTLCNFSGPGFKAPPQIAGGLADALLVLDQRDAYEPFAMLAEADAGGYRELGLLDQQRRKVDRADRLERLRQRCPGEHRGLRRWDVPAGSAPALPQHVAASLVGFAHLDDAVLPPAARRAVPPP